MLRWQKLILFSIGITNFIGFFAIFAEKAPKLTLVIVIDQFANHELQKLTPYFQGGLKFLNDNSIKYINAFYQHGLPETGVDHTTIGTATWAKDHGIVANSWYNRQGKHIVCDHDTAERAAVFSPTGTYNYGISAHNIMVDTLSDQLKLNSFPDAENTVFSLSLKSRAAVGMAGRLGKALWFDTKSGWFTSSKAYFDELPLWVKKFNTDKNINNLEEFTWKLNYPADSFAYKLPYISSYYQYAEVNNSVIGEPISINRKAKYPFDEYFKTPMANQLLLDFADRCITEHLSTDPHKRLIVWLSLSGLDKVGHVYGPQSLETIDMLYQIDTQLGNFFTKLSTKIAPEDTVIALTADHGVVPILEAVRDEGLTFARRIDAIALQKKINKSLAEKYGLEQLIYGFKTPAYYYNHDAYNKLDKQTQKNIIQESKNILLREPGIKNVWTPDELEASYFDQTDLQNYYKNQLFRGRSGDLICQTQPYNFLDEYKSGTGHGTPYDYDTHVPLMLYQKNRFEKKVIGDIVAVPQLTITLAALLDVPRPSASTFSILPGITLEHEDHENTQEHSSQL